MGTAIWVGDRAFRALSVTTSSTHGARAGIAAGPKSNSSPAVY